MNIPLDEALADPNFHAQKFVNLLANSKDAAALLGKYHTQLGDFVERANERIVACFSSNHGAIMTAAREANLIASEVADLRTLLVDQSKFIQEISGAPQLLPDVAPLCNIMARISVDSKNISGITEIADNQERILQIEKLNKALDVAIITRKYNEIPSIINNIERYAVNFDPDLQYKYQSKLNLKISEICSNISKQILNINPILLTDSFSIENLISVLINLKQPDFALKIYLELIENKINKRITYFPSNSSQVFSNFIHNVIKCFYEELTKSKKYINDNFSQTNIRIIYYLSAKKMIKSIVKRIFLQASMSSTSFLELCDHFSSVLTQMNEKINELELDLYTLFRNSINSQIEPSLSLFISNHIREIEALYTNHPFIKLDISVIEKKQMDVLKTDNSISLCTDDDVIPAICYLDVILKAIIKKCPPVVKSKIVISYSEKLLSICLYHLVNLVNNPKSPSKEYGYTLEYFNKIIKTFKDKFPKSNFAFKNNLAIKSMSVTSK